MGGRGDSVWPEMSPPIPIDLRYPGGSYRTHWSEPLPDKRERWVAGREWTFHFRGVVDGVYVYEALSALEARR